MMDNLVFEPKVYLVGRQTVVQDEVDRFLTDEEVSTWTTDTEVAGEKLVEVAGRLCYLSFINKRPGGNEAYIDHLLSVGHGSCLEHAVWNLVVTGISRSASHELVRHRAGVSPSQLSQRYVDESDCEFVVPPIYQRAVRAYRHFHDGDWKKEPTESEGWKDLDSYKFYRLVDIGQDWVRMMEDIPTAYKRLVDQTQEHLIDPSLPATDRRKMAREAARSILPNATETKIFLTFNARAIRNFLELRASRHAEAEIRVLANKVYEVMLKESVNLFSDYEKVMLPDGTFELTTKNRKV